MRGCAAGGDAEWTRGSWQAKQVVACHGLAAPHALQKQGRGASHSLLPEDALCTADCPPCVFSFLRKGRAVARSGI